MFADSTNRFHQNEMIANMITLNDGRPSHGMTLDQAAALPIYDEFRGLLTDAGIPMERERAMIDLIAASPESQDAQSAYATMVSDMGTAYQSSQKHQAPKLARDGRVFDALDETERAYELMIRDITQASVSNELDA